MFATRNERYLLACLRESSAEVTTDSACAKDSYFHKCTEKVPSACKERRARSTNKLKGHGFKRKPKEILAYVEEVSSHSCSSRRCRRRRVVCLSARAAFY